jgi:hypothetical protein
MYMHILIYITFRFYFFFIVESNYAVIHYIPSSPSLRYKGAGTTAATL